MAAITIASTATGYVGSLGVSGYTGSTGIVGSKGYTGSGGIAGYTGSAGTSPTQLVLTSYTTGTLAALTATTGTMVFVINAIGGAQPCYYDGVHWYTVNGRIQVA